MDDTFDREQGSYSYPSIALTQLTSSWPKDLFWSYFKGPPVHPTERAYPCCIPTLGEFRTMPSHRRSEPNLMCLSALRPPLPLASPVGA